MPNRVLAGWMAWHRARGLSDTTCAHRASTWRGWYAYIGDRWPYANHADVVAFLHGRQLSTGSIARERASLASLYLWASLEGLSEAMPTVAVPPVRRRPGVPRPAPHAVVTAAVECDDARIARACGLMAYAGARCVEVSRLRVGDIDHHAGAIYLDGKGGRRRWVPVVGPMRPLLYGLDGLEADAPVYPRKDGRPGPARPERISREVGDWLARCSRGGPAVTPHQLRHYYACQVHRRTKSLEVVQLALGHASISTTQVYAALGDEALAGLEAVWPAEGLPVGL